MIDSAGREPAAARQARWVRRVVLTVLRALASTTALVGIYYLLPLDRTSIWGAVAMLGAGLLALIGLIVLQVRSVIKATYPAQRAVEALATSAPLFLLLFAGTYFVMGSENFSEPMSRTDALYFTVTVFATVGFGDIVATSEAARALVTGQMVAGIVVIGIEARIIVDAVKYGRDQQPLQGSDARPKGDGSSSSE
ncbi:MAG TPA: potassium channel family protein [Propionibacteriaceae bacterium]|nr:potassium channel family protein [Propionibacteriaceae bacterium]